MGELVQSDLLRCYWERGKSSCLQMWVPKEEKIMPDNLAFKGRKIYLQSHFPGKLLSTFWCEPFVGYNLVPIHNCLLRKMELLELVWLR